MHSAAYGDCIGVGYAASSINAYLALTLPTVIRLCAQRLDDLCYCWVLSGVEKNLEGRTILHRTTFDESDIIDRALRSRMKGRSPLPKEVVSTNSVGIQIDPEKIVVEEIVVDD